MTFFVIPFLKIMLKRMTVNAATIADKKYLSERRQRSAKIDAKKLIAT